MPNNDRIPEAIADLDMQECLDLTTTTIKYGVLQKHLKIDGRVKLSPFRIPTPNTIRLSPMLKRKL
jgi:hypothetical protein